MLISRSSLCAELDYLSNHNHGLTFSQEEIHKLFVLQEFGTFRDRWSEQRHLLGAAHRNTVTTTIYFLIKRSRKK